MLQYDDPDSFAEALVADAPPPPAHQAEIVARTGGVKHSRPHDVPSSSGCARTPRSSACSSDSTRSSGRWSVSSAASCLWSAKRSSASSRRVAILSFVVAFGVAKAFTNLGAGVLADRVGRKRLLVIGWLVAFRSPAMIALAPSWGWIVAANVLLGINQGFAWSMTVVMKIDLAGPARRGLALGLNEAAGYLGVAVTAFLTGALAASYAPQTVIWVGGVVIVAHGVDRLVSVRTGHGCARRPRAARSRPGRSGDLAAAGAHPRDFRQPVLRACSQAGLVNNLNDALAWGLAPLYLAANGASAREIGIVAAVYPALWGPASSSPAGSPITPDGSR